MHLIYPMSSDFYSHEELLHLLKALGFPRNLFEKNAPDCVETCVTVESLIEMCENRYFHNDLHNTVNMKSGGYNAETLKKSLVLVASKVFRLIYSEYDYDGLEITLDDCSSHELLKTYKSFSELERIRLAFETYEEFDQRGMKALVPTLMKAFKISGWTVSPLRLKNKLRHLQPVLRERGRIQLCEFLDFITFCVRASDSDVETDRVGATEKTSRNIYRLDEMREMILPKDELIRDYLDRKYVEEESQYKRPPSTSKFFTKKPVASDRFQAQVNSAYRQYERTRNRLKDSAKQILRSKNGSSPTPNNQLSSSLSRKVSARTKPSSAGDVWVSKLSLPGDLSRRSSVTNATTFKSAPVVSSKKMRSKKPRAQSSPPVVNDSSQRELATRVKDLRFDIETEKQRWEDHARQQVAKYIYKSEEVLKRIRKPPPAPGVRKRRPKIHTQPPNRFTRRMAEPGPMLPRYHVTHCDAITQGLGGDSHATALKSYGDKVQKVLSKERKTKSRPTSSGGLLEKLLQDNTDSCVDEPSGAPETFGRCEVSIGTIASRDDEIVDATSHVFDQPDQNSISKTDDLASTIELATSDSWKQAKFNEAYRILCSDTSRVFLDAESPDKASDDHQVEEKSCGDSPDIFTLLVPPPPVQDTEQSEFEKFLKSNNDFTIPAQEMRRYDDIHLDWIKHRPSFRRLRARSASIRSEIEAL